MAVLERIWELLGLFFGGLLRIVERLITSLFGSANARQIRKLQSKVDAINALEAKYQEMDEEQLKRQTVEFRRRLAAGETLDDLLVEAFALCREAGRRFLNMRHYDVQMIGGMVLHSGSIAEMVTGEGKTLVATLPAYLNALTGKGVHVITVNPYLARRDMEWMGPLYQGLGLTVAAIFPDMDPGERQRAYDCDITYGTNNEFGFDYLRDNMKMAAKGDSRSPPRFQQCQKELTFAIIDEVDNILIDEARTPLIIAGPAHDDVTRYAVADRVARQLKKDIDFEVKEKEHSVNLTEAGVRNAEQLAGVESFYTIGNMDWPHLIDNSLKAHHLYKRDVNYVVQKNEVVIVDEFTGRLMPGRHWSDGLHQAVEAKEGVKIQEESQTYATITLQNFFKLYKKICGMTGTAMTESSEFWKIYHMEVVAIPTNKPMRRRNFADVIFRSEREKYDAIVNEIDRIHRYDLVRLKSGNVLQGNVLVESPESVTIQVKDSKARETVATDQIDEIERHGRPVLVGTVSIEKSEKLSTMLNRRGIKHQVLNAKHHEREAEIIAQAGRMSAVTIATNMAGRGTDIILGGNPETMAWAKLQTKYPSRLEVPREEWNQLVSEIETKENMKAEGQEVRGLGGLHVIGTERHEARRIDLQLRGRTGRQGDPGTSRFFLSLDDDLMRIFAGEWVKNILTRLGMKDGEAIENMMVTRRIEGAQKKVEERNFEIRKSLLEYDEVMDEQRKRVYSFRQGILQGVNCKSRILDMIRRQIDLRMDEFLAKEYGVSCFTSWAGSRLRVELDAKDFRGLDMELAVQQAKEEAQRQAESYVFEIVDENLPSDVDPGDWSWEALAKTANARWGINLRDRDLKKMDRDSLIDFLQHEAKQSIEDIDLSEGVKFLDGDFAFETTCSWAKSKFGITIAPEEIRGLEPSRVKLLLMEKAEQVYEQKEIEFPVLTGLLHFASRDEGGHKRFDREGLVAWAKNRFRMDAELGELREKSREEFYQELLQQSGANKSQAAALQSQLGDKLEQVFNGSAASGITAGAATGGNGALTPLVDWFNNNLNLSCTEQDLARLDRESLQTRAEAALEDQYHPEIRRMERNLVLQILDTAWKEHLLAMDHLKSSVGIRGYAQVDPKVEYKREGMRIYDQMWNSIDDQVTSLIFRMEDLDDSLVSSTWVESEATHDSPVSTLHVSADQQQAAEGGGDAAKIEPIRNRRPTVGRNDPCPCGSGKKFKNCCMKNG